MTRFDGITRKSSQCWCSVADCFNHNKKMPRDNPSRMIFPDQDAECCAMAEYGLFCSKRIINDELRKFIDNLPE